jgi:hypothetical protein
MLFVAAYDVAAIGEGAYGFGGEELTFVGTHQMEAFEERLNAAVESVEAEAEDKVGLSAETLSLEEAPYGVAAHELGAVEERKALFALQLDGLPAELGVDFFDIATTAFVVDVAQAEDGGEHEVGQRAEVAAGAEAALLVDDGENVVVVAVDEPLDGLQLGTAVAKAEVLGFEQEHETDDLGRDFVADATGVAYDEVLLQLAELLAADADVAEAAEASGDTVDGYLLVLHLLIEVVAAFFDAAFGLVAQGEGHLLIDNLLNLVKSELFFGIELINHGLRFKV